MASYSPPGSGLIPTQQSRCGLPVASTIGAACLATAEPLWQAKASGPVTSAAAACDPNVADSPQGGQRLLGWWLVATLSVHQTRAVRAVLRPQRRHRCPHCQPTVGWPWPPQGGDGGQVQAGRVAAVSSQATSRYTATYRTARR